VIRAGLARAACVALLAASLLSIPGASVTSAATLAPVTIHDDIVASTFTVGYPSLTAPGNPVRIRPGDTVVWVNRDVFSHDVSFSAPACSGCQPFYAHMNNGETATLTFTQPGYYQYLCVEHQNLPTMHGLFWVDPSAPV
jgi:plastocyanin